MVAIVATQIVRMRKFHYENLKWEKLLWSTDGRKIDRMRKKYIFTSRRGRKRGSHASPDLELETAT
jgi:hypothetical protein